MYEAMESYRKVLRTDIFYSWDITASLNSSPFMYQNTSIQLMQGKGYYPMCSKGLTQQTQSIQTMHITKKGLS